MQAIFKQATICVLISLLLCFLYSLNQYNINVGTFLIIHYIFLKMSYEFFNTKHLFV